LNIVVSKLETIAIPNPRWRNLATQAGFLCASRPGNPMPEAVDIYHPASSDLTFSIKRTNQPRPGCAQPTADIQVEVTSEHNQGELP
jgi:hypothetical protein